MGGVERKGMKRSDVTIFELKKKEKKQLKNANSKGGRERVGVVVYPCNPSPRDAEARRPLGLTGQLILPT